MYKYKENSTIGIVAPSSPTKLKHIEKGIAKLNSFGHEVILGNSCNKEYRKYLSGEDDVRRQDIDDMFKDKNIDIILCQNGGYGTPRIVDKIDYSIIKNNPKPFSGFSDITTLLNTIYMKTGLITYHGPMLTTDFANPRHDVHVKSFFDILKGKEVIINKDNEYDITVINEGIVEGILVGGNLSLLSVFVAMEIGDYFKDKILLIEELNEKNFRIDRMMQTVRLAGVLDQIKGIIIGGISGETTPQEGTLDLFKNLLQDYDYPIIFNAPIGHVTPRFAVPIGGTVRLDTTNKTITVLGGE